MHTAPPGWRKPRASARHDPQSETPRSSTSERPSWDRRALTSSVLVEAVVHATSRREIHSPTSRESFPRMLAADSGSPAPGSLQPRFRTASSGVPRSRSGIRRFPDCAARHSEGFRQFLRRNGTSPSHKLCEYARYQWGRGQNGARTLSLRARSLRNAPPSEQPETPARVALSFPHAGDVRAVR